MSQEEAARFIALVGGSTELQAEVGGYRGAGVLKRLVTLGAQHGLRFTEEEYRAAVVELAEGALSDEALDEVLRETGLKR